MWQRQPPFEHVVETVRTAEVARALSLRGPVIPSIPLSEHIDPKWWFGFLAPGRPGDIAIDLGTKVANDWTVKVRILAGIRSALSPLECRLVAYGVSTRSGICDVFEVWGSKVLFASLGIVQAAHVGGKRIRAGDLSVVTDYRYERDALVRVNAETYEHAVADIASQVIPSIGYRGRKLHIAG